MKSSLPTSLTLISIAITSTLSSGLANAQSERTAVLEEVIVTAQRRESSLQDTPISISAFGSDELAQIGVFQAIDVGTYSPNVHITKQSGSQDNYGYSIRGLANSETAMFTEPTVGVYIDGIYLARTAGAAFDIADLERVEVLRGPQGTLYGRNTIGGAVNLISAKPTGELGFKQQFSGGSRGYWRSQTHFETNSWNNLSAKFSYARNEKDGLTKNIYGGDDLGALDTTSWRVALRWEPTEDLVFDYTYDDYDRESDSAGAQLSYVQPLQTMLGGAIYEQESEYASENRKGYIPAGLSVGDDGSFSEIEAHTLTVAWTLGDITLKSITSYRDQESGVEDTDFGSFPSDGVSVLDGTGARPPGTMVPAGELVSLFSAQRLSTQEQFTQEFQIIGNAMGDKLQYTAGLYYFEEEVEEDNPQSFVYPAIFAYNSQPAAIQAYLCGGGCYFKDVKLAQGLFNYGGDTESWAAYGQLTYGFTDQLDVTLGARYTVDDKDQWLRQSQILRNEGIDTVSAKDDWSNFNPSLTFNYQWTEDLSTYLSYTSGYRSGGFNPRASTSETFTTAFNEEEVDSFEFGFKSDWLDSRLRINGAVFYYEYNDRQVSQFFAGSAGASTSIVNAGDTEALGFEVEITALPMPGLLLQLNYGYLDYTFNEFVTSPIDPITGLPVDGHPDADPDGNVDIADEAVPNYTPDNTGSFAATYTFEPFDWGTLSARVDVTYVDKIHHHPVLHLYTSRDEQTHVNARVTLSDIAMAGGNVRISAWGKNITNESDREFGIDFGTLGFSIVNYQELASWGIDLSYEYN